MRIMVTQSVGHLLDKRIHLFVFHAHHLHRSGRSAGGEQCGKKLVFFHVKMPGQLNT